MRQLLVDDMVRPRHLGRPGIYRFPLPKTMTPQADTSLVVPAYESAPVQVNTTPAFMLSCKCSTDVPFGSVRLILGRKNTEFASEILHPAFVYANGYDSIEVMPARVSEAGTGSVFMFGTVSWVETVRVRLFYPVESFSLHLLTDAETTAYKVKPIVIWPAYEFDPLVDPILEDDFERET